MKKGVIVFKIDLSKDDFNTSIKVEKKNFSEKEKILLRIALFSLKDHIENIIPKI